MEKKILKVKITKEYHDLIVEKSKSVGMSQAELVDLMLQSIIAPLQTNFLIKLLFESREK